MNVKLRKLTFYTFNTKGLYGVTFTFRKCLFLGTIGLRAEYSFNGKTNFNAGLPVKGLLFNISVGDRGQRERVHPQQFANDTG